MSVPHGWDKANANFLTELEPRDPVTGYTEMKALLCRISKVSPEVARGCSRSSGRYELFSVRCLRNLKNKVVCTI